MYSLVNPLKLKQPRNTSTQRTPFFLSLHTVFIFFFCWNEKHEAQTLVPTLAILLCLVFFISTKKKINTVWRLKKKKAQTALGPTLAILLCLLRGSKGKGEKISMRHWPHLLLGGLLLRGVYCIFAAYQFYHTQIAMQEKQPATKSIREGERGGERERERDRETETERY